MTPEESVVEILHDTGFEIESAEDYAEKYATIKVGKRGSAYVEWGWEEGKQYVPEHCSSSIMEGTSFIKYPKSTSDIIETTYQAWEDSDEEEDNVCEVDLTGCLVKTRNRHTGLLYDINFDEMVQINKQSKFKRSIRREVHYKSHASEAVNSLPVPDPKPGTDDLFDSTVDSVTNPKVFVVYHDAQVYPEYLVTFH